MAPFLQPDLLWDFRLPRVKSINVSGHKYGLAPLGVGWVVWRDTAELPEELIFPVNYLGGEMPTFGINFSRPGSQVVASTTTSCASAGRATAGSSRTPRTSPCTSRTGSRTWGRSG